MAALLPGQLSYILDTCKMNSFLTFSPSFKTWSIGSSKIKSTLAYLKSDMLTHNFLLRLSIRLANFLFHSPIYWDKNLQKLCISEHVGYQSRNLSLHQASIIICLIGGVFKFYVTSQAKSVLLDIILFGVTILMLPTTHLYVQCVEKNAQAVLLYINSTIACTNFDHQPPSKTSKDINRSRITQIKVILAYNIILTAVALPVSFVYGLHWNLPCSPSLVGYFLNPSCSFSSPCILKLSAPFLKLGVLVMNHVIWAYTIRYIPTVGGILLLLCPISFEQTILK